MRLARKLRHTAAVLYAAFTHLLNKSATPRPVMCCMTMRYAMVASSLLGLSLLLSACGDELGAPATELRLFSQNLDNAFLNEEYSHTIRVVGGLSPYTFELSRGELPEGLRLQGGTIRGTASALGRFTFTISVSDANLSRTFREYSLQVVEAPPASLRLDVPNTEVRDTLRIPVTVEDARDLQGLRTLLSWDATFFELVPGSVRRSRNNIALFERYDGEGNLNVDLAFLGSSISGNQRVFEFELRPLEPNTVEVRARIEFRSRDGQHAFSRVNAGRPPQVSAPADSLDDGLDEDLDEDFDDGLDDAFDN